jgi:hypothetical protein
MLLHYYIISFQIVTFYAHISPAVAAVLMAQPSEHLKRRRTIIACEPCRERKRKCNGGVPCTTCSGWGYDCYYERRSRTKAKTSRIVSKYVPSNDSQDVAQSDGHNVTQCLEANSGAAFVRRLGLKIDPANAPKMDLFGWNIGARELPSGLGIVTALPIVDILSLADMKALADVYFKKVDACYGILNFALFSERLESRWRTPLVSDIYDSVLAGVAALGSLFSQRSINITERHLVQSAVSVLEPQSVRAPCVETVTGWALRVIYLRMTSSPHATWLASSTLMHLIEASGLHQESSDDTVLARTISCDPEIRRRIVGVAQHLNMWASYDLGLSRVLFYDSQPLLPKPRSGDYTAELLNMLPISSTLGPEKVQNARDLESSLLKILNGTHTAPPSVLAQCNLVLCLLRRLWSLNPTTSSLMADRVFPLLQQGLRAARSMVLSCCPWHHVANVPFHIISILLEIGTPAALGILPEAMQTLKLVASTYDTNTMREAYSTACLLVLLHQQRRSEDAKLLSALLNTHDQPASRPPTRQASPSVEEISWLEGLVADMPTLQGVDLCQFLQADMGFSPEADILGII